MIKDSIFKIESQSVKEFYFRFAKGDTVYISSWVIKGDNVSSIEFSKWDGGILFYIESVPLLENKTIYIPADGIYVVTLRNTSLWREKLYGFRLFRKPTSPQFNDFRVNVIWDTLYDTTYVNVVESTLIKVDTVIENILDRKLKVRAGSVNYVGVYIPPTANYWAYWVGVGQEAWERYRKLGMELSKNITNSGIIDPLSAFAINLIPHLVRLSQGLDIDYYILSDKQNFIRFKRGERFFYFKGGKRIVSDYAKIQNKKGRFYIAFNNTYSILTDKIVSVKVITVEIRPHYKITVSKKPVVRKVAIPR